MFDINSIFAGSIKDVYKGSTGSSGQVSYNDSLISQARIFNVPNTPRDKGLHNGDIFHIKNINSRLKERLKVIRDLLDKAPVSLTSQSIIKIKIQYASVNKCNFRVQVPGHLKAAVFLKVRKN